MTFCFQDFRKFENYVLLYENCSLSKVQNDFSLLKYHIWSQKSKTFHLRECCLSSLKLINSAYIMYAFTSKILQNSSFYHIVLSFLFVSLACVCQIFIFISCWLNRKTMDLLVWGLNLFPHIDNDLSETKSHCSPCQLVQKSRHFTSF